MRTLLVTLVTALALAAFGCSAEGVSDASITTKVKSKLAADTRTSAVKIEVDTVNGVVTLTGAVPSAAEKAAAGEIAKATEDVKSVTNNLTVQPGTSNADQAAGAMDNAADKTAGAAAGVAASASDALIQTKIKTQLVAAGIIGTNIDVTNGAVVLKGEVDNAQEKTQAEAIAKKTEDVKSVSNQLVIKK
jgi:hyperosmotically inducible periplasmic protein